MCDKKNFRLFFLFFFVSFLLHNTLSTFLSLTKKKGIVKKAMIVVREKVIASEGIFFPFSDFIACTYCSDIV